MKKICRWIFSRGGMVSVFIFLAWIGFVSNSYGGEWEEVRYGFSFLAGTPQKSNNSLKQWGFLPKLSILLHKNWDLEFEGNICFYNISNSKDLYVLGVNENILFKPIQWDKGFIYFLGGFGVGYNNNSNTDRRVRDIGDSHVAGILQAGSGIQFYVGKRWWIRAEYRFYHISDPFRQDSGINTHNLILGFYFY